MKDTGNIRPPRMMLSFFRWFCQPEFREDIEGDLVERFHNRMATLGARKARWLFTKDVLVLFRPGIIRSLEITSQQFHPAMFRNYFKVAFRIFRKEKGYTLTNIFGLALGISCSLFIYLWLNDERRYNNFFENSERVCFVMSNWAMTNGEIETWHSSPYNLKEVLEENYPSVEKVAVLTWGNWMAFEKEGSLIEQAGIDASPELFEMFEIPFLKGDHKIMYKKPQTIAISESFANSYFGDRWKFSNVIGEIITNERGEGYELIGIFTDIPRQSTLRFEFLIPFELHLSRNQWLTDWDNNASQMYVKLAGHVSLREAEAKIKNAVIDHYSGKMEESKREIFLQPFRDIYLYNRFENGKMTGGRIEYVRLLSIAAVLILLLASINFINLSTARSAKRAKETGVRKVLGSYGANLKIQFLTESVIITTLALLVSLCIVYLLLPQFNSITGKNISLDFLTTNFALYLGAFVLVLGVLTGLYPAFYLSSMKAISSLKGIYRHDKGDVVFRKGLVVFQYVITIMMITAAITVYYQVSYIQSKNIGIDRSNLVRTWTHAINSAKDYEVFKSELLKRPGIEGVTVVNHNLIDVGSSSSEVAWEGKTEGEELEFYILSANPDLLPTAGIKLKDGRNFDWNMRTDTANFIINEAAQKLMGLQNPIGADLKLWDLKGKIIGVVQDFHNASLHSPIEPLIIRFDQSSNWMILTRTIPGQTKEALASLEEVYHLFNPKREFKYEFMDDVYNQYYKSELMVKDLSLYFTVLSIIISSLGLFALVAYTAEQRTKEIGIRKVLGATISNILQLLSKEFLLLIGISLFIAMPLAYYVMMEWLSGFAYRIDLSWWLFALGGVVTFVLSYSIIGSQAITSAIANPVDSLKND